MKKTTLSAMFESVWPTRKAPLAQAPSAADIDHLCRRLLSHRNDPIGIALAAELVRGYEALTPEARNEFFVLLADKFAVDKDKIIAAAHAYEQRPGTDTHLALARAVESPSRTLFRSINMAPGGTSALVKMRADLLQQSTPRRSRLRTVEHDLRYLLQSWFNRGFLHVERIDWDSPASLLEKIITYEAVHEINGWEDLRRRLEEDRRCFAFFHPSMPNEPLVFVEVALTAGIAREIQTLIARDSEVGNASDADTAMFYSISNCQTGLSGISFGGFLIKQVVEELQREFPHLSTFATLSPVPRFRTWLSQQVDGTHKAGRLHETAAIVQADLDQHPDWHQDAELREKLRWPLLTLCSHYLVNEQLDDYPLDPVARFHLGNGATLQNMNWLADTSEKGLSRSAGLMVNYVYELEMIEKNRDRYVKKGDVNASEEIRRWASQLAELEG